MNQAANIFIFIGPPGAGKGSLASLCVKHLGWLQVSTGNLCRKHIVGQTKIGKKIDLIIKSGKLIEDNLVTSMVFEWFNENFDKASGIIFDGYPRTIVQARAFNNMLRFAYPMVQVKVVLFYLSDDVVVDRLCSRYICKNKDCQAVYSLSPHSGLAPITEAVCDLCFSSLGKREDDNEVAVRERLNVYHHHEQQLIDFYCENGNEIIKLDGSKRLCEVFECFKSILNEQ